MIPVFITKVKTKDGLYLDGIVVHPGKKSKTALVWIHGLSSRFYSTQTAIKELSSLCQKNNIGFFKFNNRGHDLVVRGEKELIGSSFENFKDCIWDIKAVIGLAKSFGYKNIILSGHSTGANKVLYYMYKTRDRSVKGLILAGPINDVAAETARIGKKKLLATIKQARKLYKKNPKSLIIQKGRIYSAGRYLSLYEPGWPEDVFPYNNPSANWKELKSICVPIAVILGERDEYLDRPAKDLIKIFQKNATNTKSFFGTAIKGSSHSFIKKEKELAHNVVRWINGL